MKLNRPTSIQITKEDATILPLLFGLREFWYLTLVRYPRCALPFIVFSHKNNGFYYNDNRHYRCTN